MTLVSTFFKTSLIGMMFCAASPAQANIIDRISLEVRPVAKFKVVDSGAGFQTLLVVSNAAFDVSIEGVLGEVNIDVSSTGQVGGKVYGSGAQLPGAIQTTTHVVSPLGAVVYESDRATAAHTGTLWEQAVHFTISYDPIAKPRISVDAQD